MKKPEEPEPPRIVWECIGHCPTQWALGQRKEQSLFQITATVIRKKCGSWQWMTFDPKVVGIESSRDYAMDAAEKVLRIE